MKQYGFKAFMFPFMDILRNIILASYLIFLSEYNYFQLMCSLFLQMAVLIFQGYTEMVKERAVKTKIITDELVIIAMCYILICFTNFVESESMRYNIGWSMIGYTCVFLLIKIGGMMLLQLFEVYKKLKLRYVCNKNKKEAKR